MSEFLIYVHQAAFKCLNFKFQKMNLIRTNQKKYEK